MFSEWKVNRETNTRPWEPGNHSAPGQTFLAITVALRSKEGHNVAQVTINSQRPFHLCNPKFAYLSGQYSNERYFWTCAMTRPGIVFLNVCCVPAPFSEGTRMSPLAKLIQSGAQRAVTATRARLMRNEWCKIQNTWPCLSCSSSSSHYRRFSASAARCGSSSSTQRTASYSYVVVGAGSAGCVLANRLTEDAHESVMLLEAGPKDRFLGSLRLSWKIHMPAALIYNLCDDKYIYLLFCIYFPGLEHVSVCICVCQPVC